MDKFFGNLHAVLAVGLALAIGLMFAPYYAPPGVAIGVFQWLHVFFGIVWIGLLYYFNFVQIPTMPEIPAELKPGVSKYIAPKALFFFRWGAAFTVLTGLILAYLYGELHEALKLEESARLIGIGMYLALIMAFNVWFVIWPNQKKALGLVPADDAAKAKAAKTAMIFSRTNTLLSIPMLLCMVAFR
ncbi:urate hydroxylase PuuD [Sphingomonas canadensis]|uniref:Urate hydroxylase PuuD n=1 Tax=Sphingomonas canadensis TaxID=1219257 RepID=A0ABW3HEQ1_9SPHN|nr:urate hydroxylase PuuD [Sphingomonas canadensis]MCW3837679.1 urate hydroxylase PuuD [Sphingomonas canadensis]